MAPYRYPIFDLWVTAIEACGSEETVELHAVNSSAPSLLQPFLQLMCEYLVSEPHKGTSLWTIVPQKLQNLAAALVAVAVIVAAVARAARYLALEAAALAVVAAALDVAVAALGAVPAQAVAAALVVAFAAVCAAVLQMTIEGRGGEESWLDLPTDMEEVATFQVDDGIRGPAAVAYDFSKLVIGYKPWHGEACYITRMDKENVQGLDSIFNEFQAKSSFTSPKQKENMHLTALVDRSSLGTTLNILCSHVPIFWA
ncbi:hypothetical protein JD844_030972 [Phrynosoma platyrhinos]|uniref:BRICHOS domain-containing protein n=1 Tax=Phrynosoma platyrhinos TaxID=52577 RepID=A0ABQ7T0L1_PHRPL|nr:hypothetical protein JD844_030972 [Phrynosoma platyrhinos]